MKQYTLLLAICFALGVKGQTKYKGIVYQPNHHFTLYDWIKPVKFIKNKPVKFRSARLEMPTYRVDSVLDKDHFRYHNVKGDSTLPFAVHEVLKDAWESKGYWYDPGDTSTKWVSVTGPLVNNKPDTSYSKGQPEHGYLVIGDSLWLQVKPIIRITTYMRIENLPCSTVYGLDTGGYYSYSSGGFFCTRSSAYKGDSLIMYNCYVGSIQDFSYEYFLPPKNKKLKLGDKYDLKKHERWAVLGDWDEHWFSVY